MVKILALEDGVPTLLVGEVLDDGNVEVFFPFGVQSKDVVSCRGSAHCSGHVVAGFDESLDDMGGHEGVGSGEECGRHCECLLYYGLTCWVSLISDGVTGK